MLPVYDHDGRLVAFVRRERLIGAKGVEVVFSTNGAPACFESGMLLEVVKVEEDGHVTFRLVSE